MANPEMWKVATETDCDFIACGGPVLPEEMYDDPDDAAQVAAGEEDQTRLGWEGA